MSVGLAAVAIAENHGAFVAATSRRVDRADLPCKCGADQVSIDNGSIAAQIPDKFNKGFDKVLELVGITLLEDPL